MVEVAPIPSNLCCLIRRRRGLDRARLRLWCGFGRSGHAGFYVCCCPGRPLRTMKTGLSTTAWAQRLSLCRARRRIRHPLPRRPSAAGGRCWAGHPRNGSGGIPCDDGRFGGWLCGTRSALAHICSALCWKRCTPAAICFDSLGLRRRWPSRNKLGPPFYRHLDDLLTAEAR